MEKYTKIEFVNLSEQEKEILIALLSEKGFDGFEERENDLDAFIPAENYNDDTLDGIGFPFAKSNIEPENWNEVWESNFHPVIVDDFVAVRADFHPPVNNIRFDIVITPKMSFGTGHHATTHLMMQQMREIDFTGKTVFDFGTGTGILAILADKLNASMINAIDNDEWSINNATENIQQNNCNNISLRLSDKPSTGQQFDIILANITKNIILENFSVLSRQLNKNGILLLSGLLEGDEEEILNEGKKHLLTPGLRLKERNWLCMRFLR
ncbi:MAG: 50S ribosomal protein L11 methyltransferase [Chitinophagaceae bacterium]